MLAHSGLDLHLSTHILDYSQYHDTTLTELDYSIGKVTSILATGGYRPQAVV